MNPIEAEATAPGIRRLVTGTLIGTVVSLALTAGAPAVGTDSASHAVERLAHAVGIGLSDAQARPPVRSDERLKRDIEQTRGALTLLHGLHRDREPSGPGGGHG